MKERYDTLHAKCFAGFPTAMTLERELASLRKLHFEVGVRKDTTIENQADELEMLRDENDRLRKEQAIRALDAKEDKP